MTPKEKAEQIYKDAYTRWCYELSHDKNHLTAKDISLYMCNEIIDTLQSIWHAGEAVTITSFYWRQVKQEIIKL